MSHSQLLTVNHGPIVRNTYVNGQLITNKSTIRRVAHCQNHTKDYKALERLADELLTPCIKWITYCNHSVLWIVGGLHAGDQLADMIGETLQQV